MYRILVVILFFTALPASAAQVRSGEHAGFSRLVFRAPNLAPPQLDYSQGAVTLSFVSGLPQLQTDAVFDRITRDRIQGLAQNGASLTLNLNCNCQLRTFTQGSFQVIDVLDPSPSSTNVGKGILPIKLAPVPERFDVLAQIPAQIRSAALSQGLVGAFNSALEAGFLKTSQKPITSGLQRSVQPSTQLRARTPLTPDFANALDNPLCRPAVSLDFSTISQSMTPLELLTEATAQEDQNLRAAQYLSLGFGQEAIASGDIAAPYLVIAHLIDDLTIPASNPFSSGESCQSAVALWALLTQAGPPQNTNQVAVYVAYQSLPAPLRKQVAPLLSSAAMEHNLSELQSRLALKQAPARIGSDIAVAPDKPLVQTAAGPEVRLAELERHIETGTGAPLETRDDAWALLPSVNRPALARSLAIALASSEILAHQPARSLRAIQAVSDLSEDERETLAALASAQLPPSAFALFTLAAEQSDQLRAFLTITALAQRIEREGLSPLFAAGPTQTAPAPIDAEVSEMSPSEPAETVPFAQNLLRESAQMREKIELLLSAES